MRTDHVKKLIKPSKSSKYLYTLGYEPLSFLLDWSWKKKFGVRGKIYTLINNPNIWRTWRMHRGQFKLRMATLQTFRIRPVISILFRMDIKSEKMLKSLYLNEHKISNGKYQLQEIRQQITVERGNKIASATTESLSKNAFNLNELDRRIENDYNQSMAASLNKNKSQQHLTSDNDMFDPKHYIDSQIHRLIVFAKFSFIEKFWPVVCARLAFGATVIVLDTDLRVFMYIHDYIEKSKKGEYISRYPTEQAMHLNEKFRSKMASLNLLLGASDHTFVEEPFMIYDTVHHLRFGTIDLAFAPSELKTCSISLLKGSENVLFGHDRNAACKMFIEQLLSCEYLGCRLSTFENILNRRLLQLAIQALVSCPCAIHDISKSELPNKREVWIHIEKMAHEISNICGDLVMSKSLKTEELLSLIKNYCELSDTDQENSYSKRIERKFPLKLQTSIGFFIDQAQKRGIKCETLSFYMEQALNKADLFRKSLKNSGVEFKDRKDPAIDLFLIDSDFRIKIKPELESEFSGLSTLDLLTKWNLEV